MEPKLTEATPKYKQVSPIVDTWLEIHKGETFDLDLICRQIEAVTREGRQMVAIKLREEIVKGKLEKLNRIYRYIDNTIKYIDWVNAEENDILSIKFPWDRETNTGFSFDKHVILSPKDLIVIAGDSNAGKTAFIINMLWENMDTHSCTLMGNEYSPVKFKRRVSRMTWNNPLKEDGTPKFELIERYQDWKDIVRPDNINLIDWITVSSGEFYMMDSILQGIQSKLNHGIAVVAIQKSTSKGVGEGGDFSKRIASLYLAIDFERITVVKAKEWNSVNPNNKTYGFKIVDGGCKFHNIREIKKCPRCYGTGRTKGGECDQCFGAGYVDVPNQDI